MSEISNANKQSGLHQISKKFIQENQTHKINARKKGGPYSKADRQIRRKEVYRLHFEYGYSALKISELMKINRNTINGDIQYWYSKVVKNWNDSSPKFFVVRNVERLELQRTRLTEELARTKSLKEKLGIERMILDVESKISQTQLKLCGSKEKIHELATKWLNNWMKENNHEKRYVSFGDVMRVPGKSYEKICSLMKKW